MPRKNEVAKDHRIPKYKKFSSHKNFKKVSTKASDLRVRSKKIYSNYERQYAQDLKTEKLKEIENPRTHSNQNPKKTWGNIPEYPINPRGLIRIPIKGTMGKSIYTKEFEIEMDHETRKFSLRPRTRYMPVEVLYLLAEEEPEYLLDICRGYEIHVINDKWDSPDDDYSEAYLGKFIPTLLNKPNPSNQMEYHRAKQSTGGYEGQANSQKMPKSAKAKQRQQIHQIRIKIHINAKNGAWI